MGQSPGTPISPTARPTGFMPGPMSGSRPPSSPMYSGSPGGKFIRRLCFLLIWEFFPVRVSVVLLHCSFFSQHKWWEQSLQYVWHRAPECSCSSRAHWPTSRKGSTSSHDEAWFPRGCTVFSP